MWQYIGKTPSAVLHKEHTLIRKRLSKSLELCLNNGEMIITKVIGLYFLALFLTMEKSRRVQKECRNQKAGLCPYFGRVATSSTNLRNKFEKNTQPSWVNLSHASFREPTSFREINSRGFIGNLPCLREQTSHLSFRKATGFREMTSRAFIRNLSCQWKHYRMIITL